MLSERLDQRIWTAVTDVGLMGDNLSVATPVRRLSGAAVLWLNERWWLSQGIDLFELGAAKMVEEWLLDTYAVRVCGADRSDGLVFADRYGGTGGTAHGGSGRCAWKGAFNAKGIGRTSLVPAQYQACHSDGRLSLREAVREAIAAEIVDAELPFGAVPVIAIIDPGDIVGDAIAVRPNFVRPAHFERSIFFGSAGRRGSDQYVDGLRTRDAILAANDERIGPQLGFPGLDEMAHRFARQAGVATADRLWQGRFLSSNAAISGAMVDFGSFRSVPSWHRWFGKPEEMFGTEAMQVESAMHSIRSNFRRYGVNESSIGSELRRLVASGFEQGFAEAVRRAVGLQPGSHLAKDITAELNAYRDHQQRSCLQIGDADTLLAPWLYEAATCGESHAASGRLQAEMSTMARIRQSILDHLPASKVGADVLNLRLAWWLKPRTGLYYEKAERMLSKLDGISALAPQQRRKVVSRLIDSVKTRNRRHWPNLPAECVPLAQFAKGSSTIVAASSPGQHEVIHLEAGCSEGAIRFFGESVTPSEWAKAGGRVERGTAWLTISCDRAEALPKRLQKRLAIHQKRN